MGWASPPRLLNGKAIHLSEGQREREKWALLSFSFKNGIMVYIYDSGVNDALPCFFLGEDKAELGRVCC